MDTNESNQNALRDTSRIKGFSDGVFAVIITITVLSIHAPVAATFSSLFALLPLFFAYLLSFTNLGIYWTNHHHLLYTVKRVHAPIMWANLLLLFFLSLLPVSTEWIGANPNAVAPVVTYGLLLLCSAIAYTLLQKTILHYEVPHSLLRKAIGTDVKGKVSAAVLVAGIAVGFFVPYLSYVCYVAIVLMWIVPDKRLESVLGD